MLGGVWQLCSDSTVPRPAVCHPTLWHRRAGGLWQVTILSKHQNISKNWPWPCQATFDCLPQHRRLPGLLQHHQPRLVRQCAGEVGARDPEALGPGALPARWHSVGPQDRPGYNQLLGWDIQCSNYNEQRLTFQKRKQRSQWTLSKARGLPVSLELSPMLSARLSHRRGWRMFLTRWITKPEISFIIPGQLRDSISITGADGCLERGRRGRKNIARIANAVQCHN